MTSNWHHQIHINTVVMFFFHLFFSPKMVHVTKRSVIADENGKECNAMEIFSIFIKHLADSVIDDAEKKLKQDGDINPNIRLGDIDFFITVPSYWDDTVRMLMIEAAKSVSFHPYKFSVGLPVIFSLHFFPINFKAFSCISYDIKDIVHISSFQAYIYSGKILCVLSCILFHESLFDPCIQQHF